MLIFQHPLILGGLILNKKCFCCREKQGSIPIVRTWGSRYMYKRVSVISDETELVCNDCYNALSIDRTFKTKKEASSIE